VWRRCDGRRDRLSRRVGTGDANRGDGRTDLAAKRGVLFQQAISLEQASRFQAIIFDKASTAADVSLACMPQFHIGGSLLGLLWLHMGGCVVITPEPNPAEILRLVATERVSMMFLVPALMLFCCGRPAAKRWTSPA
jgi:acyl-CoA synthetase (AMP-forming)/AMP-acid ligase II